MVWRQAEAGSQAPAPRTDLVSEEGPAWSWRRTMAGILIAALGLAGVSGGQIKNNARAADRPTSTNRFSAGADGAISIGGHKEFLIGAGWISRGSVEQAQKLGVDFFISRKPGTDQASLSAAVGDSGYVVPELGAKNPGAKYNNVLGYVEPDEPDANHIYPPTLHPEAGKQYLVRTERVAKTGKFIFLTLTPRFMSGQNKPEGITDSQYEAYIDNADVVLIDAYPGAHGCVDPNINLSTVYDSMVELKRRAPNKTAGAWIEIGPMEGYCGDEAVNSQMVAAEQWAVAAGGAQIESLFPISWPGGVWSEFKISGEMAATITHTNQELKQYSDILLARRQPNVVSTPADPIKVGIRLLNGRAYLIAVNLSGDKVDLSKDELAATWQDQLPGLNNQTVSDVISEVQTKTEDGRIIDNFSPYGKKIYSWRLQVPFKPNY